MMTDSEELNHPHRAFLVNASERLEEIEQDLLSLKNDRNPDRINHLIKRTHALRGTAESLEFPTVVIVAHLLEEILNKLLNPLVIIDPELESLLLRGYECLKLPLRAKLTRTQIEEPEILKWIIDIFAQLNLKLGHFDDRRHRGSSEDSIDKPSTAVVPGTDVVQAIFETWIGKRLANLAFTLAHADAEIIAAQLREQCRVFNDISTQLNLKGFGDIAKIAVAALDLHPEQANTIAQIALADFLNGQTLVLSGDRQNGGQPSLKLQQLSYRQNGAEESPSQTEENSPSRSDQEQTRLSPAQAQTVETSAQLEIDDFSTSHPVVDTPISEQTQQTAAHRTLQQYLQDVQGKLAQLQEKLTHFQSNYSSQQKLLGFKFGHRAQQNDAASRLQPSGSAKDAKDISPSVQDQQENPESIAPDLSSFQSQTQPQSQRQLQTLQPSQESLPRPRDLTLESLFRRMPHLIEKWTEASGKQIEVSYQGHQVRIETEISRQLYHLILSLTRNAITFGIEETEVRRKRGKSESGQIHVTAEQSVDGLTLAISHDGQCLNFEQIRRQAIQIQLQSSEQVAKLSDPQLLELLLLDRSCINVWDYSLIGLGRGFRYLLARIYELNGSLSIHSTRERGTSLVVDLAHRSRDLIVSPSSSDDASGVAQSPTHIKPTLIQPHPPSTAKPKGPNHVLRSLQATDILPSSPQDGSEPKLKVFPNTQSQTLKTESLLKTESVLIWLTDSIVFALPYDMIVESVSPDLEQITQSEQHRFLQWDGKMLPLYSLAELLNSQCKLPQTRLKDDDDAAITFVIQLNHRFCAVESRIKCLITKSEITIHPFSDLIQLPSFVYGCTVLEDKQIVFVVDAAALIQKIIKEDDQTVPSILA